MCFSLSTCYLALISSYLCLYILPVQLIDQLTKLTECHLVIQQQKQHKSRDQPVKQPMDTFQIDSLAKMVGVFLSSELGILIILMLELKLKLEFQWCLIQSCSMTKNVNDMVS